MSRFKFEAEIGGLDWSHYSIVVGRSKDNELYVADERVTGSASNVPLYEVVGTGTGPGHDLRVAYNNFARGGRKPQITCTDQMAVLLQMQTAAAFESGHKTAQMQIPRVCSAIQSSLAKTLFLDPQPASMRGYSFKSEVRLDSNGANLSGVLHNICQQADGSEDVLAFIRSLPEQNLDKIDFIETPRGEVMVELQETFGGQKARFDATLLSDGTLRVLSVAGAMHSAPAGSLVVIEEIDNGVHPSRAGTLLNSISSIAKRRDLHVLLSSHNPALLDALPNDAVPHVVFCYRSNDTGASRLVRLQDIADYPELIAQGSVGHLMTTGLIEKFVKHHPGPEERRQRSLTWLEQMRKTTAH